MHAYNNNTGESFLLSQFISSGKKGSLIRELFETDLIDAENEQLTLVK